MSNGRLDYHIIASNEPDKWRVSLQYRALKTPREALAFWGLII
jgi:hypothetical protein